MVTDIRIGDTFTQDGSTWRVSAITETFILGTRASVKGEPLHSHDIIKVMK